MTLWRLLTGVLVPTLLLLANGERVEVVGDEEAAARLFAKGQDAYKKKEYELASVHFDDAYAYARDNAEALYLSARSYEKAGKDRSAFLTYRKFVKVFDELAAKKRMPASLVSFRRKAEGRVKSLGKVTLELEKIQKRHVDKLVAFARERAPTDPDVALRALERARDVACETSEIDELIRRIRPKVDVPPDRVPSPFEDAVEDWKDLIAEETFGFNDGWTYSYGTLEIDVKRGNLVHSRQRTLESGPHYVYEVEARVRKAHGGMWVVGLLFGHHGDERYAAVFDSKGCQISRFNGMSRTGIEAQRHEHRELGVWHRLSVKVDGKRMELWLDGEKILAPDPAKLTGPLDGDYGMTAQGGIIEIRELRIGEIR